MFSGIVSVTAAAVATFAVTLGAAAGTENQSTSASPMCRGKTATIVGTAGNNEIDGTPQRDIVQARGGNDEVDGHGGRDLICGGRGSDDLSGDARDDAVFGQRGNDELDGNRGADRLVGGKGFDEVDGGPENDSCSGEDVEQC
jgi:Ca2+-binding RTX toxin-like protein